MNTAKCLGFASFKVPRSVNPLDSLCKCIKSGRGCTVIVVVRVDTIYNKLKELLLCLCSFQINNRSQAEFTIFDLCKKCTTSMIFWMSEHLAHWLKLSVSDVKISRGHSPLSMLIVFNCLCFINDYQHLVWM